MNALLAASGGLQTLADAPASVVFVLKITAFLSAAWLAHLALAWANPRWRVLLWRATAVGLIALPAIAWVLPALEIQVQQPPVEEAVLPAAPAPAQPAAGHSSPGMFSGKLAAEPAPLVPEEPVEWPAEASSLPQTSQTEVPAPAPSESSLVSWPTVLLAVWLAGVGLLALRWSIGHYRIGQMVRGAKQAPPAIRDECLRVARAVGCPNGVDVRQSALVESPLVCGFLRPVLLLPPRMCEHAYREDVPAILAHEMTHVRFHDLVWNAALNLVAIALWLHPLAWRVRRAHLAACELVCDGVSADFVGSVADYCRTLARVAVESVTASSAAGIAMARTSSVSRRLAALRRKVFHKPLRGRSVVGFALAVLVGVAALGALRFAMAASEPEDAAASAAKPDEKAAAEGKKQSATATDSQPKTGSMLVRVVDESGKPLGGTKLTVSSPDHKADYTMDVEGKATVVVPTPNAKYLSLIVSPEGYPPVRKWWPNNASNDTIPAEFTFAYEKGRTIGGVVRDEQGKPIPGVRVALGMWAQRYAQAGMSLDLSASPVKTDAEGRWHLNHAPQEIGGMVVGLEHPDYIREIDHPVSEAEKLTIEDSTSVMVMKKGIPVSGTVTDPDGKPVANAKVSLGSQPSVRTDQKGQYRVASLAPGETLLTVVSPGLAPALSRIKVQPGMNPVDSRLEKGKTLRVRVVDKSGKPLEGIDVAPDTWRAQNTVRGLGVGGKTDRGGRWTWTWAPSDAVGMRISKTGFMSVDGLSLTPQEAEHVVTLSPAIAISGKVVDADTKQPIPSFHVIPGIQLAASGYRNLSWIRVDVVEGKNGRYELLRPEPSLAYSVRIEAEGYRPAVSRAFKSDEGNATCDFSLSKGHKLNVMVLLPDGKPAADADVRLCLEEPAEAKGLLTVKNGRFSDPYSAGSTRKVGADGRLLIEPQESEFVLMVLHEQGIAQTTSQELVANPKLTLTAWARLEGVVRQGTKPVPSAKLVVETAGASDPKWPFLRFDDQTMTDAEGKFALTKLKPRKVYVSAREVPTVPSRVIEKVIEQKTVDLAPGQTLKITLGGAGRPVVGRIVWPHGEPPDNGDLSRIQASASLKLPARPSPPKAILDQGPDAVRAWLTQWSQSEEGKAWQTRAVQQEQAVPRPKASVDRDGALRIEAAVSGPYTLSVSIKLKEDLLPWEQTRSVIYHCEFSVPEIPGGVSDEPLDLGNLTLQGEAPRELPAGPVKPPAPQRAGEKSVGGLRDNLELLRYVLMTCRQNQAKIRTWQGKATIASREAYETRAIGVDYSANAQFVFDRARKSVRWNTTLEQWTVSRKGVKEPQPVPQISNGMQTPAGFYRVDQGDSPVNPARRPLPLTIDSPDVSFGRMQYDFNPLHYYSLDPPYGSLVELLSNYLARTSEPAIAMIKVIREGDLVTIEQLRSASYSISLSQGCNPVRYISQLSQSTRECHWTYELRDGIWLPKTWTETIHEQNTRDLERKVTFVENRVNQPVEPEAFSLSRLGLKPGDNVDDRRTGQKYQYEGK
ncbi:MAG: carboxypeptidase regulatory-like domain-containing protein [Pirellulales bacterium]